MLYFYFQAQQRAVTKDDYITRVYALPPKFGNVAKAYVVQDSQLDSKSGANSDAMNSKSISSQYVFIRI